MDCNSIIYDSVHLLEKDAGQELPTDFEYKLIKMVIAKIEEYICFIKPTKTVYIAFDGIAPMAKLEQQKKRRYKNAFMKKYFGDDTKMSFDTNQITPGTPFMDKLSADIENHFNINRNKYGVVDLIVSTANEDGEGEHKIFHHIRDKNNTMDSIALYGLDSDLIMLSLLNREYSENIFIFRETPEFLKSSIPIEIIKDNPSKILFLDTQYLANCINLEMESRYPDIHRVNDYVFLCFFLGNDFLPGIPSLNIRTHGLQVLLDTYRKYIGAYHDRYLISKDTKTIEWNNVKIIAEEIGKIERDLLLKEEMLRSKNDRKYYPENTKEEVKLKMELIASIEYI
jgi:5'-3' exonuclease